MTHDDLTNRLRAAKEDLDEGYRPMKEAADRLDRYRDLLKRSMPYIDAAERSKADALFMEIREAIEASKS